MTRPRLPRPPKPTGIPQAAPARHRSFDPKGLGKLAVIMVEGLAQQRNNQANTQADLPCLVEDEFVQVVCAMQGL